MDLENTNESPALKKDSSKSRLTEVNPPSVYYKGASHLSKKVITDFNYRGNHLDVAHLSSKRLGPTPHLSQLQFETGLRHYGSQASLDNNGESRNSNSVLKQHNNRRFITIFEKVPRFERATSNDLMPTFLPPLKEEGKR